MQRFAPERAPRSGFGGKGAGDQLVLVVHAGGEAVHGADEAAFAAADHAETQAACSS